MKMIEVTLLKEHTHAGIKKHPGAVIEVEEWLADWLIKQGAAEIYEAPKKTPKNEKEPAKGGPKGE